MINNSWWNLSKGELRKLSAVLRAEGIKLPKPGYQMALGDGETLFHDYEGGYRLLTDHNRGRFDEWIRSVRSGAKEGRQAMRARDKGIRSYGPGKFHTVLDSLAYEVVLNGVADAEASFPDGGGAYALVTTSSSASMEDTSGETLLDFIEKEGGKLTDAEREFVLKSKGVIFFERSDGIVEAEWFKTKKEMDKVWKDIEKDTEEANREDDDEGGEGDE